jgi:PAB-dependent poly(A)-specific ribonuclease subunit 2
MIVAPSSPDPTVTNQWHLFNDFLVTPITKEEALRFDPAWKLPSVLAYQLKVMSHAIDESWKSTLDTSILYKRWSPT